ncbi:MAG: hypothetical protein QNJ73_10975 [Gammaproteobacteria bacterium]|nr:hypothetical protein [Gammaproteobacteria bacterium]
MIASNQNTAEVHTSPVILTIVAGLASVLTVGALAFLLVRYEPPTQTVTGDSLEPPVLGSCDGERPGHLRGRIYGDMILDIDWTGNELKCDGMLRPGAAGTRLLFSPAAGGLLIVIGIDAPPDSLSRREIPITLTIADETSGRFFSSAGTDRCWASFDEVLDSQPEPGTLALSGLAYCSGSLPAVNSSGSVTPGELSFAGRLTLSAE